MKPAVSLLPSRPLRRRDFLKLLGSGGAAFLAACQGAARATLTPNPTRTNTAAPSQTPAPTVQPSATPTPRPTLTPTPTMAATVATGKVRSYEHDLLRAELERMLDGPTGLGGLVKSGTRVGIKANLTGGTWWDTPDKPPATEFFVTHPAVVGVLCELLKDAGAAAVTVMDGLGDETSFDAWGYRAMADPLGVRLVDLCKPDPYPGYARFAVSGKGLVYDSFFLNGVLNEVDVFISIAKLKTHTTTGVTLALKNLIGLAPISEYRLKPEQNNRSAFHGSSDFDTRLPRVIIDLHQARRVDFALIDGIFTAEAGAGPWDTRMAQVRPGVLLAGRDVVATDAIGAAMMGFDPDGADHTSPYIGGENHLALAREAGLGTNRLEEIGVLGPTIAELRYPFKPAR